MNRGWTAFVIILVLASSVQIASYLLAENVPEATAIDDPTIGFDNDAQVALMSQFDHLEKEEAWGLAFKIRDLIRFYGQEPAAAGGKIPVFTRGRLSLWLECDHKVLTGDPELLILASQEELCSDPGGLQEQNFTIAIDLSTHPALVSDIYDDAINRTSLACYKTDRYSTDCSEVERGFQIDILIFGVEEHLPDEFVEKLNDLSHRLIVTARDRFREVVADRKTDARIELRGQSRRYLIPVGDLAELNRETIDGTFLVGLKQKSKHVSKFGILVVDPAKHHQDPEKFSEILTLAFGGAAAGTSLNGFEMKQTLQDVKLTRYEKRARLYVDPQMDLVYVEVLFLPTPGSKISNPVRCKYKLGSPDINDGACAAWLALEDTVFFIKFSISEISNVARLLADTQTEISRVQCAPEKEKVALLPSADTGGLTCAI